MEGSRMKKRGWKLPPGKLGAFLVSGCKKEQIYSSID